MKNIKLFENFLNEAEDESYERWVKALHLYDTNSLDSDIQRYKPEAVKETPAQDKQLSSIFRGSKISSRFISRSGFDKWKTATKAKYDEDCKSYGKSKIDDLVDRVLGVFNQN